MVLHLPAEFGLPEAERARLQLGTERAVFEKPVELGKHVKLLYVKGHLDEVPINHMLVDGGHVLTLCHMPRSRSWGTRKKSS
jgi:hypothetical protein